MGTTALSGGGTHARKAGGFVSSLLTWSPPTLTSPTTVSATGTTTQFTATGAQIGTDLIVNITGACTRGLFIEGWRHVRIIGGEINTTANQNTGSGIQWNKGVNFKNCTGTLHLEGILAHGGYVTDFVYCNSPEATLQIQNCRALNLRGKDDDADAIGEHADVLQAYGIRHLRIDRLTATSSYQGLFLRPERAETLSDLSADIRRMNIEMITGPDDTGRHAFTTIPTETKRFQTVALQEVFITPSNHASHTTLGRAVSPQDNGTAPNRATIAVGDDGRNYATWPSNMATVITGRITQGTPPGGDFVPAATPGMSYVSPGYA